MNIVKNIADIIGSRIKDYLHFSYTGILSYGLSIGLSVLFIDYIGWTALKYNLIWVIPFLILRVEMLKLVKFNQGKNVKINN